MDPTHAKENLTGRSGRKWSDRASLPSLVLLQDSDSSENSGKRGANIEERIVLVTAFLGHWLDHSDLVDGMHPFRLAEIVLA